MLENSGLSAVKKTYNYGDMDSARYDIDAGCYKIQHGRNTKFLLGEVVQSEAVARNSNAETYTQSDTDDEVVNSVLAVRFHQQIEILRGTYSREFRFRHFEATKK